jgi:uncharacterized protein (TIGR02271 family)
VFRVQTQASVKDLMDRDVTDQAGHKIGTVKQVYLNDVSGEPEWVRVHTGLFGTKESFVPLADARHTGEALTIPYDKDKVKHAPQVDADQHLSREQVADLYRYYGLRAPQQRESVPGQVGTAREGRTRQERGQEQVPGQAARGEQARREEAARQETAGRERRAKTDPTAKTETMQAAHGRVAGERAAMGDEGVVELTLLEERLRVGTERHESERVRLRKRIEIEHIERTVPVYKEELRIEREPIGEGEASGAIGQFRIGEEERVVTLHEERPVVSKETVPVERIRVRAERVAGEHTVRDEVRKERIDVSHEGGQQTPGGMSEGPQARQRPGKHERP